MSDDHKSEFDQTIDSIILGWADLAGIRSMVSSAYNRGMWRGGEEGEERGKRIQRAIHKERRNKVKEKKP